jgi:phage terminase large subunit-like protein
VWCNAGVAWINPLDWEKCKDLDMQIEHFENYPCYIGLDLASKKDIASRMRLFVKIPENSSDGKPHYYLFSTHYTPSDNIEGEEKAHYQGWAHDGYLTIHQGARIDIEEIQNDIKEDAKIFDLTGEDNEGGEVCGDPWNAQQLMTNLMSDGIVCVEIPQTVSSLSEPMKELEVLILEGRLHHDGNPVTSWMFQNVYCEPDHKDNIYPRKENKNSPNKIDGAVATINAMARAMYYNPEPEGNDGSLLMLDLDWS